MFWGISWKFMEIPQNCQLRMCWSSPRLSSHTALALTLAFVYIMPPVWSDVLSIRLQRLGLNIERATSLKRQADLITPVFFLVQVVFILALQLKPAFNAGMKPQIFLNLEEWIFAPLAIFSNRHSSQMWLTSFTFLICSSLTYFWPKLIKFHLKYEILIFQLVIWP